MALDSYQHLINDYIAITSNLDYLRILINDASRKYPHRSLKAVQYLMDNHPEMARNLSDLMASLCKVRASYELKWENVKTESRRLDREILR